MVRSWGGWIPWIKKDLQKLDLVCFTHPDLFFVCFFWFQQSFPMVNSFWRYFIALEKLRGVFPSGNHGTT